MWGLPGLFGTGRKSARATGGHARRGLRGLEPLEPRWVLASVADISIASTQWSAEYISALADRGLGEAGFTVRGNETVAWTNIDQVRIRFTTEVSPQSYDLSVKGVRGPYPIGSFRYDARTHTAVWTLLAPLEVDKVLIDLDGRVLGRGSDDNETRLNVVPGDVDQDATVENADYVLVDQVDGTSVGQSHYDPMRDLDGTGAIDFGDLSAVLVNVGDTLPWGEPSRNDPPVIMLWGEEGPDDLWAFFGTVTDRDPADDPTGWQVDFFGILAGKHTTVRPNGTFSFATELGSTSGLALAQTQDDAGVLSNMASFRV